MKPGALRQELVAFAALSRAAVTLMLGHGLAPFAADAGGGRPRRISAAQGASDAARARWNKFDDIAGQQIITALRQSITNMKSGLQLSLWIGPQGLITRIRMDRSSGEARIDDIAANQVLRDMRLPPPPPDMPLPLVLSVIITPGAWIYSLDQPRR